MLLVCGITHRQGYKDIAVVTIGGTLLVFGTVGTITIRNRERMAP